MSGATFPLGTTTVTCTATDAHGNTATGSLTVTVHDTTPPAPRSNAILSARATVRRASASASANAALRERG